MNNIITRNYSKVTRMHNKVIRIYSKVTEMGKKGSTLMEWVRGHVSVYR
jgi:hypothetical protein